MESTRSSDYLRGAEEAKDNQLQARVRLMQAHAEIKRRSEQYEAALGLIVMIVMHGVTDISEWVAVAEEDVTISYPRPGGSDLIVTQVGRNSPIWQVVETLLAETGAGTPASQKPEPIEHPVMPPCSACGGDADNFCHACGG